MTVDEEREAGLALSRNPFTRELFEAITIYHCEGKLDGFTSELARESVRKRFGDEGVKRWDEVTAKFLEALGDS